MSESLADWEITIPMSRRSGGPDGPVEEERQFTFIIPAVDAASAHRGAVDIGLGVNEASGYQWKLKDSDEIRVRAYLGGAP